MRGHRAPEWAAMPAEIGSYEPFLAVELLPITNECAVVLGVVSIVQPVTICAFLIEKAVYTRSLWLRRAETS